MKDTNTWIKPGIKLYCIHKSSLYACTKYSVDYKALAHFINTLRTGTFKLFKCTFPGV